MSLIKCPECKKEISSYADSCIYCGCPMEIIKKKILNQSNNINKEQSKNINKSFYIDYVNENEYKKKERAIKKYNMLAYKKLMFDYYPSFREGNFAGIITSQNNQEKITKYELKLPTDSMFAKVHGDITLHYTVYEKEAKVELNTITPEDILTEGSQKELTTYKGVMVSKSHRDMDMFKINLLNSLNRDE